MDEKLNFFLHVYIVPNITLYNFYTDITYKHYHFFRFIKALSQKSLVPGLFTN